MPDLLVTVLDDQSEAVTSASVTVSVAERNALIADPGSGIIFPISDTLRTGSSGEALFEGLLPSSVVGLYDCRVVVVGEPKRGTVQFSLPDDDDAPHRLDNLIDRPPPATPDSGLPPGGMTGQILEKRSDKAYDVLWADPSPSGGSAPSLLSGRTYDISQLSSRDELALLDGDGNRLISPQVGFLLISVHEHFGFEGDIAWRLAADLIAATSDDPLHLFPTGGGAFADAHDLFTNDANEIIFRNIAPYADTAPLRVDIWCYPPI